MRRILFFVTAFLFCTLCFKNACAAEDDAMCKIYKQSFPALYKVACGKNPRRSSPAGAGSTFASALNVNPANLPNQPSSYGVESLGHSIRGNVGLWAPTFSLLKGFQRVGAGLTTGGDNTFYSNDIIQRARKPGNIEDFHPHEPASGKLVNLNLGTSFVLYKSRQNFRTILGTSVRYNNTTTTVGGALGVIVGWPVFSVGVSAAREKVSNQLDRVNYYSTFASLKLGFLELEGVLLQNVGGYRLNPIQIATLTASLGRVLVTGAVRKLNYYHEGVIVQKYGAMQLLLSSKLSIGYMYNYIPGANTVALQIYL